jgi:hypothetical protein
VDHLSMEGDTSPHNPVVVPGLDGSIPVPAPMTQLLGINTVSVVTCLTCRSVRSKQNLMHVIDMVYPRKVS